METLWAGVQEQARLWRLGTLLPLILGCLSERKQVQQQVRGTGTTHTCGNAPPPQSKRCPLGDATTSVCVCVTYYTQILTLLQEFWHWRQICRNLQNRSRKSILLIGAGSEGRSAGGRYTFKLIENRRPSGERLIDRPGACGTGI